MRVLMWNVQSFTASRLVAQPGANAGETLMNFVNAAANGLYIVTTVTQADPDVFVVLETLSSQGDLGTLGTGGGPDGILTLLTDLRAMHSDQWCAVPTLRVNPREILVGRTYTETVGVFWRNDRLRFDGPYAWPAADGRNATGPSVPAGSEAAGTYPAPWNAAVPDGTTAAAQYRFLAANGEEITFTGPTHRRPYLTTFTERGGARRLVRLFSMHTKPGIVARTAVARLVTLRPADWVPGANEVTVFAGDFNLNLRDLAMEESAVLQMLAWNVDDGRVAQVAISPTPGANPPSRFMTRSTATPTAYLTTQLLDWALVRYGTGARPDPVLPLTVVNRALGVAPGGGLPAFDRHMVNTLGAMSGLQWPIVATLRLHGIASVVTSQPHSLVDGDTVRVAGVTDNSFDGTFVIGAPATPYTFGYTQVGADALSGGGAATSATATNRLFRDTCNFGHLGPPAGGTGTSDHLPVFFVV